MNFVNNYCSILSKLFRYFPSFKGKKRLARLLLSKHYLYSNNFVSGKYKLQYCLPNCVDSIGFDLLVDGIYEKQTIDFLVNNIPDRGVVLDIGSNIGSIGLPIAKLRKDATVLCIEASKSIYEYLNKNIACNRLKNIEAFNIALTDKNIDNVSFFSPSDKFGKGSFSPVFTSKAELVTGKTLDSFLDDIQFSSIDFIKIDVEGYEFSVFKGAQKLLSGDDAPDILFEFVDWAEDQAFFGKKGMAQELLKQFGYKLYLCKGKGEIEFMKHTLDYGSAMVFATKKTK